ncbi:acetylcholinesterase-1-like [Haemaphysalis longicornis]
MRVHRLVAATALLLSPAIVVPSDARIRDDPNQPFAHTRSGIVRGVRLNVGNRPVDAFYGIPYAEPPLAQLRFRKPRPPLPWKGIYYATHKRPPCAQKSWELTQGFTIDASNSTEDCLHLNIWTAARYCFHPNLGLCSTKAVMVFFHGGGFQFGGNSYSIYDARHLALFGDVVVVVPNYRLNVFGFLNANVSDAPGNMGMYDQILALQWVQKNIGMFGGDPNRVTLFGQSAGSVSAGYHLLSPLSRGLFRRVIMQSGTPYWKVPDNTFTGKLKVQQLAVGLGCPVGERGNVLAEPGKVIDCIRSRSRGRIFRAMKEVFGVEEHYMIPAYYSEFLPFEPVMATERGQFQDVDLMIGNVRNEGTGIVDHFFWKIFNFRDYTRITLDEIWFYSLLVFRVILGKNPGPIRELYLSDLNDTDSSLALNRLSDAVGDFSLICPSQLFAEAYARRKNNVYFYIFNHRPSFSVYQKWTGVAHGDELGFVFGFPLLYPHQSSDDEKILSRRMIRIWSTFARTGKPPTVGGQQWPKFTRDHAFHLNINLRNYSHGIDFRKKLCSFWKKYLVPTGSWRR